MMKSYNTNSSVYVKLTPEAIRVWDKDFSKHSMNNLEYSFTDHFDKHTHNQWTEFQMWELMQIFGNEMYTGGKQMFENNIMLFDIKDLT